MDETKQKTTCIKKVPVPGVVVHILNVQSLQPLQLQEPQHENAKHPRSSIRGCKPWFDMLHECSTAGIGSFTRIMFRH